MNRPTMLRSAGLLAASLGLSAAGFLAARSVYLPGAPFHGAIRAQLRQLRGVPDAPPLSLYPTVPCPERHLAIAHFGQSNAANYVFPLSKAAIPANLLQFDWRSGRCHPYREPLLAADGTGGNTLTAAAVELARGRSDAVIVVPFARGGASVADWASGYLSHQHERVLQAMRIAGLREPVFLWHQGESDAAVAGHDASRFAAVAPFTAADPGRFRLGSRQADYAAALQTVIDRTRSAYPDAWFGIAVATTCASAGSPPWPPVQAAQRQLAAAHPRNFLSADTDRIPTAPPQRSDRCHFAAQGAEAVSRHYLAALRRLPPIAATAPPPAAPAPAPGRPPAPQARSAP